MIRYIPNKAKHVYYPIGTTIKLNKPGINTLKRIMKETIGAKKHVTLWCRGSSGAIIAGMVSIGFPNCIINHVKKRGEDSHSRGDYRFEENSIHIIIDDFSNTGITLNAIYDDMQIEGITEVDYVCVIGHMNIPKLSFVPKNVISREAFLDYGENRSIKTSCLLEKYKFSENYKIVTEQGDPSITVHNSNIES